MGQSPGTEPVGQSLERILSDQGPFEPVRAAVLAGSLCDALATVHALGMVHGDLKPASIMVRRNAQGEETARLDFPDATSRSAGGVGGATTPAGDLDALGLVLYAMLAGGAPFDSRPLPDAVTRPTAGSRTPLGSLPGIEVPPALDAIVERSLAAPPAARFATVGELAFALERFRVAASAATDPGSVRLPSTADADSRPEATWLTEEGRRADLRRTLRIPPATASTARGLADLRLATG